MAATLAAGDAALIVRYFGMAARAASTVAAGTSSRIAATATSTHDVRTGDTSGTRLLPSMGSPSMMAAPGGTAQAVRFMSMFERKQHNNADRVLAEI